MTATLSSAWCPLTRREVAILRLIATGMTDRQIAATLGISRKTASNHVANLLHKLKVPTRAAAVARAMSDQLMPTTWETDAFPSTSESRECLRLQREK